LAILGYFRHTLTVALDQPATAKLGENVAGVATGEAIDDKPALARSKRQGGAAASMHRTPAAPPRA